jgi:DNA-3-methyladenine glycosylase
MARMITVDELDRIDPLTLAPLLLGQHVVSTVDARRVVLRITEVEAYLGVGEDPGSHSFRGQTQRNSSMFASGGHLYVYRSYGVHWCGNVVAGPAGSAGGVLLRAGEIVEGRDTAWERRMRSGVVRRDVDLARGPGRLGAALAFGPDLDGTLLTGDGPVSLTFGSATPPRSIRRSTRTGVSGPGSVHRYRFFLDGEPTVSPHRPVQA